MSKKDDNDSNVRSSRDGSSIWFANGGETGYVDANNTNVRKKKKPATTRSGKCENRNNDTKSDSRREQRKDERRIDSRGESGDNSRKGKSQFRDKSTRTVRGNDERMRMKGTARDDEGNKSKASRVDERMHASGMRRNSEKTVKREQSKSGRAETEERTSPKVESVKQVTQKTRSEKKHTAKISETKRIIIGITLVLMFVAVGALLIVRYAFDIKTIKVNGNTTYEEQEIIDLSGVELGESLFMLNTDTVKEAINKDPFLRATVKKSYPGTIVISITERVEFAKVFHSDSYIIIDDEGTVLKICSEDDGNNRYASLLTITGMNASGAQIGMRVAADNKYYAAALFDVLDELNAQNMIANVMSVDMTNPFDIYLHTTDGILIRIGQAEALDVKIGLLPQLISKARSNGYSGGIIDVSVETRPTYEFPQSIATPTPTMPQTGEPITLPQNTPTIPPATPSPTATCTATQIPEVPVPTMAPTTEPDVTPIPTQPGQS